jgi:hypothetical protein
LIHAETPRRLFYRFSCRFPCFNRLLPPPRVVALGFFFYNVRTGRGIISILNETGLFLVDCATELRHNLTIAIAAFRTIPFHPWRL